MRFTSIWGRRQNCWSLKKVQACMSHTADSSAAAIACVMQQRLLATSASKAQAPDAPIRQDRVLTQLLLSCNPAV